MALLQHPRGHLARMGRMNPVVARAGGEQHARILHLRPDVVVRRVLRNVGPLVRLVGVAILRHPARTRQQLVEASHVQQRHLADHRVEQVRSLRQYRADQQAAVAAAHHPQMRRRRDAPADQVLCDRDEVVVAALLVFLDRGRVPVRPEFPAAPDVGEHKHAAMLQPRIAECAGIERLLADLESAVPIQHSRIAAVSDGAVGQDHEVGHPRAVHAGGEMLFHFHARRVEELRRLLQPCLRIATGAGE